jgi:hypothetical protein
VEQTVVCRRKAGVAMEVAKRPVTVSRLIVANCILKMVKLLVVDTEIGVGWTVEDTLSSEEETHSYTICSSFEYLLKFISS